MRSILLGGIDTTDHEISRIRLKPEDAATSLNYSIADLLRQGQRLEPAA